MVTNSAGGVVFGISDKTKLDRFLIIGSESPTYYASARTLTLSNASSIVDMLNNGDGDYVVSRIVEISQDHRAYRTEPALFALAIAASKGNTSVRNKAMFAVNSVARTGADFLKFVSILSGMRGHGNQFNNMLRHWYNDKPVDQLAYQVIKYGHESGWSHRDVLRLARPTPYTSEADALYGYIVNGIDGLSEERAELLPDLVRAREMIKLSANENETIAIIKKFNLTWEFVPNEKRTPEVWKILGMQMPLGTTLRYLSNFSRHWLFDDTEYLSAMVERITDPERIKGSKLHPIRALLAHANYRIGKSYDHTRANSSEWKVYPQIVDALNTVFSRALRTTPKTGNRVMVAIDISGSMDTNYLIDDRGVRMPITAREVASAMALSVLRSEEDNAILGVFSGAYSNPEKFGWGGKPYYNDRFVPSFSVIPYLGKSRHLDLTDFMAKINSRDFGVTDCSIPMRYATKHRIPIDVFTIWTDNESWAGEMHPTLALQEYRSVMGINAKLVICACTATGYSVADPKDARQLDVVGFDANVANVIYDFIAHDW